MTLRVRQPGDPQPMCHPCRGGRHDDCPMVAHARYAKNLSADLVAEGLDPFSCPCHDDSHGGPVQQSIFDALEAMS